VDEEEEVPKKKSMKKKKVLVKKTSTASTSSSSAPPPPARAAGPASKVSSKPVKVSTEKFVPSASMDYEDAKVIILQMICSNSYFFLS
jgi:hypothetical protein